MSSLFGGSGSEEIADSSRILVVLNCPAAMTALTRLCPTLRTSIGLPTIGIQPDALNCPMILACIPPYSDGLLGWQNGHCVRMRLPQSESFSFRSHEILAHWSPQPTRVQRLVGRFADTLIPNSAVVMNIASSLRQCRPIIRRLFSATPRPTASITTNPRPTRLSASCRTDHDQQTATWILCAE